MKALYSLVLAIMVAAVLAGCGKSSKTDANKPVVDLPALKQAVQAFNTQEGHFPKTLDELAPKYVSEIPAPPSGFRFAYDPATGDLRIGR
jgi:hypothetical protein